MQTVRSPCIAEVLMPDLHLVDNCHDALLLLVDHRLHQTFAQRRQIVCPQACPVCSSVS